MHKSLRLLLLVSGTTSGTDWQRPGAGREVANHRGPEERPCRGVCGWGCCHGLGEAAGLMS